MSPEENPSQKFYRHKTIQPSPGFNPNELTPVSNTSLEPNSKTQDILPTISVQPTTAQITPEDIPTNGQPVVYGDAPPVKEPLLNSGTKLLVLMVILSSVALALAFVLGFTTQSKAYHTYSCPYRTPPTCRSVTTSPDPLGSLYYFIFSLSLIVSFTFLSFRLFARTASSRASITTLLLLALNIFIYISEQGAYQFASLLMFTSPPLILSLIVSTVMYCSYRLKVKKGDLAYDRGTTVLFMSIWVGLPIVVNLYVVALIASISGVVYAVNRKRK